MKTRFLFAVMIGALTAFDLRADEAMSNAIKFSDPTKPGTLKVRIGRGNVHVNGANVTEVTVKSNSHAMDKRPRKDGLRVIEAASSFSLTEAGNVVTLDGVSGLLGGTQSDYTITVPQNTVVSLDNAWGGDVTCTDLVGDVDIRNHNGEVHLDRLAGSACVESTNGEILADIQTLQPGKTYSFTSMNGEIRVRVPSETKANVRLRTQNGTILTDFDEKVLLTKTEMVMRKSSRVRTTKGSDRTRSAPEADTDADVREAVHGAIQAGAEVAREALRMAAVELRAQSMSLDSSAPMAPLPPLPPMTGGKIISGTLNGGGPEIQIATMNGDVILRKLDEQKK